MSAAVLAALSNLPTAHAQITETWSARSSGLWSTAGDWSGGVVPNNPTYSVDIIDGKSTVTLNTNASINDLDIGAGNTLAITGNTTLAIAGPTVANGGSIQLSGSGGNNGVIQFNQNVTLSGAGALTLASATSGNGAAYIEQGVGGVTLTNESTIRGAGYIGNGGIALTNAGTIDANTSMGLAGIVLNGGAITNKGVLEATAGGTLTVATSVVNSGTAALITASGTGSIVDLDGVSITGGTLSTSGGGALKSIGTNTLTGVTIAAGTIYPIVAGTETVLDSPITNHGTITVAGSGGSYGVLGIGTSLTLAGPVTLSSAGVGNDAAYIEQTVGGLTLTNTGTIQGAGYIGNGGIALTNAGTVNANTSAGMVGIVLNGGAITNKGVLEATAGGTLTVATSVVNSGTAALITASGAGSIVDLDGVSITGGTLSTSGGGALKSTGTNTLTGVTIAAGTTYPIVAGTETVLDSPITNHGTITVAGSGGSGGSYGVLGIGTSLTLAGPVTLSSAGVGNDAAYIEQTVGGLTLTNTGTIQGAGYIGNGGIALANAGTVNANTSAGLAGIVLNGGAITNTGTLEATAAGTLTVATSVVNSGTAAKITASGTGSIVDLDGVSITGGTLSASGGGALKSTGTNTLSGVTIAAGTLYPVVAGTETVLNTPITNHGTITVAGSGGNYGVLGIGSNLSLGGTVTLSSAGVGNDAAYIEQTVGGLTLTNTGTIQGAGIIGNGGLIVVNSTGATIAANAAGGGTLLLNGGGLTNSGTLQVGSRDLLHVTDGPFGNFSGTTLTGGTYNVAGTLQIDELGTTGHEIVTNAANIILNGAGASFIDGGGANALSNLATNAANSSFSLVGGRNFTTAGKFTNNGTLSVGSGSTFAIAPGKSLTNFAGTTLTGGTYDVSGTLKFAGAHIVTNEANIALTGAAAEVINSTTNVNGLANFATNGAKGGFSLAGGANLTTAGAFTTAGVFSVGTGSTFKIGGTAGFTQTGGQIINDGTLAASGGVALSGGSLFGTGTVTGSLASSARITPGNSATSTGILTDSGTYTQNSAGVLDIAIGGKTAGTQYDEFKTSAAKLGGTLSLTRLNGYIPTVGSTFQIMSFGSEKGQFSSVTGLAINSSEHFVVSYQGTDVLATVVSGAAPTATPVVTAPVVTAPVAVRGRSLSAALWTFDSTAAVSAGVRPLVRIPQRSTAMVLVKGQHH